MPLFSKQKQFLQAFKRKKYLYILYAGGVSSGKSLVQIALIHQLALDYPETVYAIVRKNISTLKRTSMPTFMKIVNNNQDWGKLKINRADNLVDYDNGSRIYFMEADMTKDPDLNKLKGVELTTALIEEANEVDPYVFNILKTRVGRQNNSKYDIKPYIIMNCNPAYGWLKDLFYDPYTDKNIKAPYYYLHATPFDNPYNTQDFLDSLKTLPEAEFERYVNGNWNYADDPEQLIRFEWLKEKLIDIDYQEALRKDYSKIHLFMGCDIGEVVDKTVLCLGHRNQILKFFEIKGKDTTEVAQSIKQLIDQYGIYPRNVYIDAVGLGAGTYHALRHMGCAVSSYKGGESPTDRPNDIFEFKNKRAESHWMLREDIREGQLEIVNDQKFVKEATAIKYHEDEKRIFIELKDRLKSRIGHSPDFLDAAVMANHARRNMLRPGLDGVMTSERKNKTHRKGRGYLNMKF